MENYWNHLAIKTLILYLKKAWMTATILTEFLSCTWCLSWCARWNYFSCRQLYCPVARYSMLFLQNVKFVYYPPQYTRLMPSMRTEFGQMLRRLSIQFSLGWSPFQFILLDIQTVSVVYHHMGGYGNNVWYKVLTLWLVNVSVQVVSLCHTQKIKG